MINDNQPKRSTCKNPNHPKKGSSIKVEPIRERSAINGIKSNLSGSPRNLLLFTLGINTAFRANELLFIKAGQVRYLKPGDDLEIKLSKTKTYRRVTINQAVTDALGNFFRKERPDDGEWIFKSKQTGGPLKVSTLSNMVKSWCRGVGLAGNYASHTLRKTWGYWQRTECDTPIPLLMAAYGHSNQRQTLSYLCIQDKEIAGIYMSLVL